MSIGATRGRKIAPSIRTLARNPAIFSANLSIGAAIWSGVGASDAYIIARTTAANRDGVLFEANGDIAGASGGNGGRIGDAV